MKGTRIDGEGSIFRRGKESSKSFPLARKIGGEVSSFRRSFEHSSEKTLLWFRFLGGWCWWVDLKHNLFDRSAGSFFVLRSRRGRLGRLARNLLDALLRCAGGHHAAFHTRSTGIRQVLGLIDSVPEGVQTLGRVLLASHSMGVRAGGSHCTGRAGGELFATTGGHGGFTVVQ